MGHQLSPRKLYQGTLGYRWFTPRSRLHSDFNYTHTSCESKGTIHLVRRGVGLVIAVVSLVGSLMSLELVTIYNPITIKKKSQRLAWVSRGPSSNLRMTKYSLDPLAHMTLEDYKALDYLPADQGGICAPATISCCFYVNTSGLIKESASQLPEKAACRLRQIYGITYT